MIKKNVFKAILSRCPAIRVCPIDVLYLQVLMTIVDSEWNLWVCVVGVVRKRWMWVVGFDGIYGCDYSSTFIED